MDSYFKKQKALFDEIESKFKKGESPSTIVKPVSDYKNDEQICLTSIAFIPVNLQKEIIGSVIEPLKKADSTQYFYPPESMHLTIQNIRTINKPPLFNDQDIQKAKEAFLKVISKHPKITFSLEGLFDLPTSLGIRAYAEETLVDLCKELREELTEADVPDNKTYASDTVLFGNISICRYITKPNKEFFKTVENLKSINLGSLKVENVNLITTNAVCHPQKTKILETYKLK